VKNEDGLAQHRSTTEQGESTQPTEPECRPAQSVHSGSPAKPSCGVQRIQVALRLWLSSDTAISPLSGENQKHPHRDVQNRGRCCGVTRGHGREAGCPALPCRSRRAPPTQRAPPSGRTSDGNGSNALIVRRRSAGPFHAAARLRIRAAAACRLFPSGEVLPSTASAGGKPLHLWRPSATPVRTSLQGLDLCPRHEAAIERSALGFSARRISKIQHHQRSVLRQQYGTPTCYANGWP
jgi:hypothetical protein